VVELVTDKLIGALFSGWNDREREGERKNMQKSSKGLIFGQHCIPFSSRSSHEIHTYL